MRLLALAFALMPVASPASIGLPVHLRCDVSGHAGCRNDICVGTGRRDTSLRMEIDTIARTIVLNGLQGRIDGSGSLDYGQTRSIYWRYQIIRLGKISVSRTRDYRDKNGSWFAIINLEDETSQLEFMCRPR